MEQPQQSGEPAKPMLCLPNPDKRAGNGDSEAPGLARRPNGTFLPGQPTGRPPGRANNLTRQFREAVTDAFQAMQESPDHKMTAWAKANPTEFYKMVARLMPQQIGVMIQTNELGGMERIGRVASILAGRGVGGTGRTAADVPVAPTTGTAD